MADLRVLITEDKEAKKLLITDDKEAKKFLHNVFEKKPKPSISEMNELAVQVGWEKRRVYRYFMNKRANAKRKRSIQPPTKYVAGFFFYWRDQMTDCLVEESKRSRKETKEAAEVAEVAEVSSSTKESSIDPKLTTDINDLIALFKDLHISEPL